MSSAKQLNILITGASGYIGGSVLDRLLAHPEAKSFRITALIRQEGKASALESVGVIPVVATYSDLELLERLASDADFAITVTDCDDQPANDAILRGLKKRFDAIGKKPVHIHTSGTGVLMDNALGVYASDVIYYDTNVEQIESLPLTQIHRPVDVAIVKAAQEGYVQTHVIMPGIVYGVASGRLIDLGIQRRYTVVTPIAVKMSIARGASIYVGEGKNIWPYVHIDDCADLYLVLFNALLEGKDVPSGREGFYFAESSEHTMYEYSTILGEALEALGELPTEVPTPATPEELNEILLKIVSSNCRCRAERSRSLGWKPKKGAADLAAETKAEVEEIVRGLNTAEIVTRRSLKTT